MAYVTGQVGEALDMEARRRRRKEEKKPVAADLGEEGAT
jgi:hypothetical protein